MSRIIDLVLERHELRFREPVRWGTTTRSAAQTAFLRVRTTDGLAGWGEVAGPTMPADLDALVDATTAHLVHRSASEVDPAAVPRALRAAVDTALLDLEGQRTGRSVAACLGATRSDVAVNALIVLDGLALTAVARKVADLVTDGFGSLKCKVTPGPGAIEALREVRSVAGPHVAVRVDPNGTLPEHAAVRWLRALEPLGIDYVEQPLDPARGIAALARLRSQVAIPIAADELVTDLATAIRIVDADAVDVLVVKPARVGGPRTALAIAGHAAAAGLGVTVSTLYETGIGLAAALHVAATLPGDTAHGLATAGLLADDPTTGLPSVRCGRIALPEGDGLGVRPRDPTSPATA